jgi:hypothetical protein
MSVRLQYAPSSEILDQLPVSAEALRAEDYARIAPLLDETSKMVQPLKRYLIAWVLFVVFSLKMMDTLLIKSSPKFGELGYMLVVVKGLMFVAILYLLDNLSAVQQK